MTSQPKRDKDKCYHDDRSTFTICDDIKYFDVNWRKTRKEDNLQPNCLECKISLLWVAKKKESWGARWRAGGRVGDSEWWVARMPGVLGDTYV